MTEGADKSGWRGEDGVASVGTDRIAIENVHPEIEFGRFPAKTTLGERLLVEADIFTHGHDALRAKVLYRTESERIWRESLLEHAGNDHWVGSVTFSQLGLYKFTVIAWLDHVRTWSLQLARRRDAGQDLDVDLIVGAELVGALATRATGADAFELGAIAEKLADESIDPQVRAEFAFAEALASASMRWPDRSCIVQYEREVPVEVEPELARFSAWYEMFPRSTASEPARHGTFADCEKRLDYVAEMGFDVLYLPPIHPIGTTNRKGRNNSLHAGPDDVGSPWAIGSNHGGHRAVHPALGTIEDFRRLVQEGRRRGIEIALDIAFQCSPDHPYLSEHPEWFSYRPDGSIQFAENPPKRYEDIIPFNFDGPHSERLFSELIDVVRFWVQQGVRVFRIDNPHTKPFELWQRLIPTLRKEVPELIFLSEAFTRPSVMNRLAKLGFSQSYTYFAWRNTKREITDYLRNITGRPVSDFLRPSLWPNTPDILTEYLQVGGRPAFATRVVLAATLSASYGVYGPPFELLESEPLEPGSEEYRDSEKYQLRHWDLDAPYSLRHLIARVNRIRRECRPLQFNSGLDFHETDNQFVICYSKHDPDGQSIVLVAVNLDPHHRQSAWIDTGSFEARRRGDRPYQVHDLLSDTRYLWQGERNFVSLDPSVSPAHIFMVRQFVRTERDFDYFQ